MESSYADSAETVATEDAPAPSALHSFKAEVKDGQIYVTADPENTNKKNMSRQPRLLATGSGQASTPGVVIVGGGSAAFHAVESLREVCEMLTETPWEIYSYRMTR